MFPVKEDVFVLTQRLHVDMAAETLDSLYKRAESYADRQILHALKKNNIPHDFDLKNLPDILIEAGNLYCSGFMFMVRFSAMEKEVNTINAFKEEAEACVESYVDSYRQIRTAQKPYSYTHQVYATLRDVLKN